MDDRQSPKAELRHGDGYPLSVVLTVLTLAGLVPLIALALFAYYSLAKIEDVNSRSRLQEHAHAVAEAVDRQLRSTIEIAEALAATVPPDKEALPLFWERARQLGERVDGHFTLADRNGQQVMNTLRQLGSPLPRSPVPDVIQDVIDQAKPHVSDLRVGLLIQPLWYVIRVPVTVDGDVRYSLGFVPRAGAMLDVLKGTYLPAGWVAVVTDGQGLIVARSASHDEYFGKVAPIEALTKAQGTRGIFQTTNLLGQEVLTAYHKSEASNWQVYVWAPVATLTQATDPIFDWLLAFAAIAMLSFLVVSLVAARVIRSPMKALVGVADELRDGFPVVLEPTVLKEANNLSHALAHASFVIHAREAALKDSEERTRNVMRELSHRTKNMLAVVQAMARRTAKAAGDLTEFTRTFEPRLAALARSQDPLVKTDWRPLPLLSLIYAHLEPFAASAERLAVEGPELTVSPNAAQNIGMAIHELATNASKYGAWSQEAGHVSVSWQVVPSNRGDCLVLKWVEENGPPCAMPPRRGFGTEVIERIAPSGLGGIATPEWKETGLHWTLEAPLSALRS